MSSERWPQRPLRDLRVLRHRATGHSDGAEQFAVCALAAARLRQMAPDRRS